MIFRLVKNLVTLFFQKTVLSFENMVMAVLGPKNGLTV